MKTFILVTTLLFLALSCYWFSSDSISESQLRAAYEKTLQQDNQVASQMFGKLLKNDKKVTLKDFKLNQCVQDSCTATVKLDTPMYGVREENKTFIVKKETDKVVILQTK